MKYTFEAEDVKARLDHSKAADDWEMTYDGESSRKPGIWLVKDHGAYIMSNGLPGELVPDQPEGQTKHVIVYARGKNPEVDEDFWDGGDDYVEFFSAEQLDHFLKDAITLAFTITETQIEIEATRLQRGTA